MRTNWVLIVSVGISIAISILFIRIVYLIGEGLYHAILCLRGL